MAVTKHCVRSWIKIGGLLTSLVFTGQHAAGAVLPEDRADIMYGSYQGDDSTFDIPAVLVRKQFAEKVSIWGGYTADLNSTASIDVDTQGSAFTEERYETSGGIDYLHSKTLMSLPFVQSDENDHPSTTYAVGVSQDFFGDLSTLSINYGRSEDEIYQNIRNDNGDITGRTFQGDMNRQTYSVSWTQVLTKSWIVSLTAQSTIDNGKLENPYRRIRYRVNTGTGESEHPEKYPNTRNSEAYALSSKYFLPYRAAVGLNYRYFTDSWDVVASNYQISYTHPIGNQWIVEGRYRYYEQTQASFYGDFFNFENEFTFMGRDKELSTYDNVAFGFGITYELPPNLLSWIDRSTVNFYYDRVSYQYDNYLDRRESKYQGVTPGEESLFEFDANVFRLFLSVWY